MDFDIAWDDEDDPDGNVQHLAEHGVTREDAERILRNPRNPRGYSRASDRPVTYGWTRDGRYVAVVWEQVNHDPKTLYPVTAFPAPPPQGRRRP